MENLKKTIGIAHTYNMGHYESLKVEVGMEFPYNADQVECDRIIHELFCRTAEIELKRVYKSKTEQGFSTSNIVAVANTLGVNYT